MATTLEQARVLGAAQAAVLHQAQEQQRTLKKLEGLTDTLKAAIDQHNRRVERFLDFSQRVRSELSEDTRAELVEWMEQ